MDNQTNQEKVLADFVALIASNDQSKQAAIQQKLEEIMKSGGMTHEAMFKKLQAIQAEQVRSKAAAAPKSSVDEGPFLSTLSADASAYPISATLTTTNPGPVPWPPASASASGPSGSRPTLTGGNTTGRISGTPAQILREEPLPITFTPDHRTQPGGAGGAARKAGAGGAGEMSMRRTIHDLVASVDPNVKIEPEVEDLLLSIADEFIDSVTNFSCRLAKHRGGDTLEVRDLQLHLERNHNIRIPGFSSDDTRISLSQASSAILPPAPPAAAAATKRGGAGAGAGAGGGTHMTLRSQRLAQVALAKREGRGV
ncbi:transcription initiation factor TFIID subunit A-domain-containing protein [Mycena olivaceomarginata]|nr:transcription initiation factor TFIID subunit A-domain-containing protein [Mycena olivaceomarginata]